MLRIAVCNDEKLQIEILEKLLAGYNSVGTLSARVTSFESGELLLEDVKLKGGYDIYILDMMMSAGSGIETAKELRAYNDQGKIIFLTSSMENVFDAFSVRPSRYILKPLNSARLLRELTALDDEIKREKPLCISVKTSHGECRMLYSEILYIDIENRAPRYHLADGRLILGASRRCKFREMISELLEKHNFILSSVGVAVNPENVRSFRRDVIKLKNGEELICSRTMVRDFRSALDIYTKNGA
ncbi:MAG: LytTR family DNA-binding domain-containing protein [Clostridia bacterium]|nr:LytTR family DNA-binding domain-containing protein [Clostridia bacterium]